MRFQKRDLSEGGGSTFLKFKDGESKIGVFRGEIYEFFQVWENGKSRVVGPEEGKSRFRLNFITKEDGELKAKIFEFSLTTYNVLAEISSDYDLEKTAVKVTRRGMGTDTTYLITPMPPKDQPSEAHLGGLANIPLNVLEHKENKAVKNYAPGSQDEERLPWD